MHLMTFMTIRKPSIFFRALVLGAQGVFYNAFCASLLSALPPCYLTRASISPLVPRVAEDLSPLRRVSRGGSRTHLVSACGHSPTSIAHPGVSTRCITDLEHGRIPEW